jgi:hypothetical protein
LLQKKEYPNCPGCKCAYLQHPDAKLPFKEYLNLFCLVLASSIPISSLYPFLYFMVCWFPQTSWTYMVFLYMGFGTKEDT